ncbi:hypothetical protein FACS1894145_3560 [Bacteroidia bacterium]|nr:hypothetical protein FACS1894145_3560 [Bacteroidia bacterium]
MFRVRIFKGEAINEKIVCQRVINPTREPAGLDELLNFIENLKNHITATVFQCYKRDFVKGEKAGKWEKTKSAAMDVNLIIDYVIIVVYTPDPPGMRRTSFDHFRLSYSLFASG